jgi:hypothetical protein
MTRGCVSFDAKKVVIECLFHELDELPWVSNVEYFGLLASQLTHGLHNHRLQRIAQGDALCLLIKLTGESIPRQAIFEQFSKVRRDSKFCLLLKALLLFVKHSKYYLFSQSTTESRVSNLHASVECYELIYSTSY